MNGYDVSTEGAARFGLLLDAVKRGNTALAAEMLVSIPAADLIAIEARLGRYGIDLRTLLTDGTR